MNKKILTIQDISCVGQCSVTAALPLISACGVECAVLPSSVLSNHTGGFTGWTFCDLAAEMPKIQAEWKRQNITFDAFYTGYTCESQIDPMLELMAETAAPGALRIVDPAMADNGVLYKGFANDFPSKMAKLCKGSDYLLPNLTEAALLLNRTPVLEGYDEAFIRDICTGLADLGAKNVILTGVSFRPEELGSAIWDGHTLRYDFNARLRRSAHGTGDVYAAVFAGAVMRGVGAFEAAALAADVVCRAIEETPEDHWYGVMFERAIPFLVRNLEALTTRS